jgi:hypothetical protein
MYTASVGSVGMANDKVVIAVAPSDTAVGFNPTPSHYRLFKNEYAWSTEWG